MGDFADDMEALSGLIPDDDESLWERFEHLEARLAAVEAVLRSQGWILIPLEQDGT